MNYSEEHIQSLDWKEHIRLRPGMYIGKLGNGNSADDGIYILFKEVMDNSIDEFVMGGGKKIKITLDENLKTLNLRDYGRGIPLGKLEDCVSKINTGGKYNSQAFKKSVGLNGVGLKAVNALSVNFIIQSFREDKSRKIQFDKGQFIAELPTDDDDKKENGTQVIFTPDDTLFEDYEFQEDILIEMIKNYTYLNPGLKIIFNETTYFSDEGLKQLLEDKIAQDPLLYPIIHIRANDLEIAFSHSQHRYHEQYYSFVNGQNTTQGGTHLIAFKESIVKIFRDFYGKSYDPSDIKKSIVGAISIKIEDPLFESQTKTKLGSKEIAPNGLGISTFVYNTLKKDLDDYLHKNLDVAEAIKQKIVSSEKERKELQNIRKIASERTKKTSLHNRKLRDSKQHYSNIKDPLRLETTLFITEGDSASGSITQSRNVQTQAVFSLKGKPLNSYGLGKKIVYENEEFNLLQAALNIEESIENLRYNNVVLATDADVDGMHIRLLLITFLLQFFPELVEKRHVYILETPLFRVRNKKETIYCYSEQEKSKALKKLGQNAEITRFKGLGEISADEFKHFIGKKIRLEPIILSKDMSIQELLEFYMGKNTPNRRDFIIDNLNIEIE